MTLNKRPQPDFSGMHDWEVYSRSIALEYRQATEEGLDLSAYQELFAAAAELPEGAVKDRMADLLFDLICQAPMQKNYPFREPSDLEGIRKLRCPYPIVPAPLTAEAFRKKAEGAWLGRICGCLLGKPIEAIYTNELHPLLKETDNYPLHRYILSTDLTEEMYAKYTFPLRGKCWADTITCAPVDDDTNYTAMAQLVIERFGRDFTPADIGATWLACQPKDAYCTAERVAHKNLINGYQPPNSAIYQNPYREWIGAQIRGDYFGYINPGNPELAAEMAWRDASVSHTKNGIYGEMFVAAMLACAAVTGDIQEIIRGGLAQIPATSRLYQDVTEVLNGYNTGVSCQDCFAAIHTRYDEFNWHDWSHTIANAMIVVAALLYGEGDFGKSICLAVETGLDTDCNGATVGSIIGMQQGSCCIGPQWTAPLHGQLETSIYGIGKVSIDSLIEKTAAHAILPE